MKGYLSAAVVAVGLLVGCGQPDPTLAETLADAGVDTVEPEQPASSVIADEPARPPSDDAAADLWDTEVADRFEVPEVIDEAYVSLVINELLSLASRSVGRILAGEDVSGDQARRVHEAVYGAPQLEARLAEVRDWVSTPASRRNQLPPGERGVERFEVVSIERFESGCVTAAGHYDLSETAVNPYPPDQYAVFVIRRSSSVDPVHNPTTWLLWDAALLLDDGRPVPLDRLADVRNLDSLVDITCRGEG